MRRLLAWVAGVAGGAAALKLLARQRPPATVTERDPAEELRVKLAESRAVVDEPDAFDSGETPVDLDLEERRRRVHEEGRSALDEMRRGD